MGVPLITLEPSLLSNGLLLIIPKLDYNIDIWEGA